MSTKAITIEDYLVDQDGSQDFTSPVYDLRHPLLSMNWQMKWEAGVTGFFIWEASIFSDPKVWETLVACEEVKLNIETAPGSGIVSLPNQWLTAGFIRFRFVAAGGSGLIQVAMRVVPT